MQQRRVRLGDILDDYCPRERRITNHAVVAMIEDEVKQTRCTTCDADHEYKEAKVPAPRRKKPEASLVPSTQGAAFAHPPVSDPEPPVVDEELIEGSIDPLEDPPVVTADADVEAPVAVAEPGEPEPEPDEPASGDPQDEWPVHRPLIRATLPRPEGQTPERKAPDFTIRQNGGRFDGQRNGNRHRGQRQAHGHSSGQPRFGNPRSGSGHGQSSGQGQRPGNRQGPSGGGQRGGGPAGEQRGGGRPGGHGGRGQGRGPKRGR
jgi:hypothetical protein